MNRRRPKYIIKWNEGEFPRRSYAYTKKTAFEKARMFSGKVALLPKVKGNKHLRHSIKYLTKGL